MRIHWKSGWSPGHLTRLQYHGSVTETQGLQSGKGFRRPVPGLRVREEQKSPAVQSSMFPHKTSWLEHLVDIEPISMHLFLDLEQDTQKTVLLRNYIFDL